MLKGENKCLGTSYHRRNKYASKFLVKETCNCLVGLDLTSIGRKHKI